MGDLSKARYAVLVAVIGLAVAQWPELSDFAAAVIQWASGIVGALWSLLRIAGELELPEDDPMVYTQGRAARPSFWEAVKKAL